MHKAECWGVRNLGFGIKRVEKICICLIAANKNEKSKIFDKFHEFDNIFLLRSLRQHPNEEIQQKANNILQILGYIMIFSSSKQSYENKNI